MEVRRRGSIRNLPDIILASQSPRRKTILQRLGYDFKVKPPNVDEEVRQDLTAEENAEMLSRLKARDVSCTLTVGLVIGCDTLVAVEDRILGKPSSPEDAFEILSFLSGKKQRVISGLCLVDCKSGLEHCGHDVTWVYTKPMSNAEISDYIATGECFGKAGAYAIQESGDRFIDRLEGSFDNVVGFPSELFLRFMDELYPGILPEESA